MNNQEKNEAVARKLGWTDLFLSENIGRMDIAGKKNPSDIFNTTVPDYCTSIEAAWEIMEKHNFSVSKAGKRWVCVNHELGDSLTVNMFMADIATMAIVNAFLKLP